VPAWIFQGGRDATVPPYRAELMLSALHAAGAVARYTLAPDAGHDEGAFETAPLEDWLLRHRRDPGPAPPDPGADAALDPAVAPVRFDTAPAGFDLIAPDGPTWTARLYDAVRATGHPASAPVQRRRRAPNGPVEQLLPSPFPVEPTSPALLLARSPAFRYVSVVVRGGAAAMAVARRRATAAVARAGRVATGEEREIALGGRGDASITELRIGIR
jgi:hypothetical protein